MKNTKFQIILFICFLMLLGLVFTNFYTQHGLFIGVMNTLLTWSFYILCIPALHGKIALGIPVKLITGKHLLYPEKYLWIFALLLNIICLTTIKWVYFSTFITHFLLQILLSPWPHWLIIITTAIATFYKFFIGAKKFYSKKILHYSIRTVLMIIALLTFLYLSYNELIILLNVRV